MFFRISVLLDLTHLPLLAPAFSSNCTISVWPFFLAINKALRHWLFSSHLHQRHYPCLFGKGAWIDFSFVLSCSPSVRNIWISFIKDGDIWRTDRSRNCHQNLPMDLSNLKNGEVNIKHVPDFPGISGPWQPNWHMSMDSTELPDLAAISSSLRSCDRWFRLPPICGYW